MLLDSMPFVGSVGRIHSNIHAPIDFGHQVAELKMHNEYQLRLKDMHHDEKLGKLTKACPLCCSLTLLQADGLVDRLTDSQMHARARAHTHTHTHTHARTLARLGF